MKNEKPPIWDAVCAAFQINPINAMFTYGDTIYNPNGFNIPEHIAVHEAVHMEQQGWDEAGAALWWGKFLRDPLFRIDQESEAYAKQYKWVCKYEVSDRNQQVRFLDRLATSLAGPLYDHCITKSEAMNLIRDRASKMRV